MDIPWGRMILKAPKSRPAVPLSCPLLDDWRALLVSRTDVMATIRLLTDLRLMRTSKGFFINASPRLTADPRPMVHVVPIASAALSSATVEQAMPGVPHLLGASPLTESVGTRRPRRQAVAPPSRPPPVAPPPQAPLHRPRARLRSRPTGCAGTQRLARDSAAASAARSTGTAAAGRLGAARAVIPPLGFAPGRQVVLRMGGRAWLFRCGIASEEGVYKGH